jgi:hypothetical protein
MHGLSHSITFTRILALDLGKFNSVFCLYHRASAQHSFGSVRTTCQTIHDRYGCVQTVLQRMRLATARLSSQSA